jgi:GNAT superfamily N-acetyltransferase
VWEEGQRCHNRAMTDLAARWLKAWTYARGLDVRDVHGWPLVHVGSATRETELVCVDPTAEVFAALMPRVAGDPRAMLTVIASDIGPYTSLPLPPGVRVDRDDETLMTGPLAAMPVPTIDPTFSTYWEEIGHQSKYVVERAERVAAEGYVGVLDADAVYDAVETTPDFQRQGLGRHVMAALANRAVERGATSGILAATASGRLLYESLGWQPAMGMWSLMGDALDD